MRLGRPHRTVLPVRDAEGHLFLVVLFRAPVNGTGLLRKGNFISVLLCTTLWITCVKRRPACAHFGEMLGSPLPVRSFNEALTWENIVYTLCIDKELKLSTHHTAPTDK